MMIHHLSLPSPRHPIRTAVAALLAAGAMASGALAQEPMTFSAGQAIGGGTNYQRLCSECHGVELEGGAGPALEGGAFSHWIGAPVIELHTYIRDYMPPTAPNSLSDPQVATIVAFLAQRNDIEAGGAPLPTDPAELEGIAFGQSDVEGDTDPAEAEGSTPGQSDVEGGDAPLPTDPAEAEGTTSGQ